MEYYDKLSILINEYTRQFYLKAKVEICYPKTYLPLATIKYLNSEQCKQSYNDISIEIFKGLENVKNIENKNSLKIWLTETLEQVENTYCDYRKYTPEDEVKALKLDSLTNQLFKTGAINKDEGRLLLDSLVAMHFSIHCKQVIDLINKTLTELENNETRLNGEQSFICHYQTLTPLFNLCKGLFTDHVNLTTFINWFDLNFISNELPKFKRGEQIKFVYILSQLNKEIQISNFNKVVLTNFGIKNYYSQVANANPDLVFRNAVAKALQLKTGGKM